MERYTRASAVLALTEVHLHVTILVDEYQKKKLQHVSMVSRSEYPPYFGLENRVYHFSFVACQADDPGM